MFHEVRPYFLPEHSGNFTCSLHTLPVPGSFSFPSLGGFFLPRGLVGFSLALALTYGCTIFLAHDQADELRHPPFVKNCKHGSATQNKHNGEECTPGPLRNEFAKRIH